MNRRRRTSTMWPISETQQYYDDTWWYSKYQIATESMIPDIFYFFSTNIWSNASLITDLVQYATTVLGISSGVSAMYKCAIHKIMSVNTENNCIAPTTCSIKIVTLNHKFYGNYTKRRIELWCSISVLCNHIVKFLKL
jgi:hypothetical protein